MMLTFQFQVSLMRLFGRVKATFADAFAAHHNLNQPFVLVFANPQKTRLVSLGWFAHVLKIAKTRHFAQIFKSVVQFVSVYVVDVIGRQFACHVQPCKPVRQPFFVVDCNSPVACVSWTARAFADKIRSAFVGFPHKFARCRVVCQDRSNMVSGNHEFKFTIGAPN